MIGKDVFGDEIHEFSQVWISPNNEAVLYANLWRYTKAQVDELSTRGLESSAKSAMSLDEWRDFLSDIVAEQWWEEARKELVRGDTWLKRPL